MKGKNGDKASDITAINPKIPWPAQLYKKVNKLVGLQ